MKPEPKAAPKKGTKRKEPEPKTTKRIAKRTNKKQKVEKQREDEEEPEDRGPVFEDVKVLLLGDDMAKSQSEWKKVIEDNGGKVVKKISDTVGYVVATDAGVTGNKDTILKAIEKRIPVVGEDFLVDSLAAKKLEDQSLYRLPLKQIERDDDPQKVGDKRKADAQGGGDEKSALPLLTLLPLFSFSWNSNLKCNDREQGRTGERARQDEGGEERQSSCGSLL